MESAHKGVNKRSKYVTQVQQRAESPKVTLTWHACKYKVHQLHQRYILFTPVQMYLLEDVPLVEFMCLVFTRTPGDSHRPDTHAR